MTLKKGMNKKKVNCEQKEKTIYWIVKDVNKQK